MAAPQRNVLSQNMKPHGGARLDQNPMQEFGRTARSLSQNPLGIIALFIVLVHGLACLVVVTEGSLTSAERPPVIYFLVVFPFVVLGVFAYLVAFRAGQLFAPSDFKNEATYLKWQEMTLSAVASLTVAKQTKNHDRTITATIDIDDFVRSVRSAANFIREGAPSPTILWVDDNPSNNVYERSAFESFGIKIVLSENTSQALKILSEREFDAIISDMGRREGQREGYVLLDALRV